MRTREEYGKLLDGYSHRNLSNAEAITAGLSYLLAQTNLLLDIRDQNERIESMLTKIETRLWVANVKASNNGLDELKATAQKLHDMMHSIERGGE